MNLSRENAWRSYVHPEEVRLSHLLGHHSRSRAPDMSAPELYTLDIERYCSSNSLRLAEIFSDINYSGFRNPRARPALSALVSRRKDFSCVVVPKLARFGRNLSHLMELLDLFDADRGMDSKGAAQKSRPTEKWEKGPRITSLQ
jgi:Resolvase, N terminal domain